MKLRYAAYKGSFDEGEQLRIAASDLYQHGDTILVWVNEGDLCMVGECLDTPPERQKAREVINRLCSDPDIWATHGCPSGQKLKRLEDEFTLAFASR